MPINEELFPKRDEVQEDGKEEDFEVNDEEENIAEVIEEDLVHPIMQLKQPIKDEKTDRAVGQGLGRKRSPSVKYYVSHSSSEKKKRKKSMTEEQVTSEEASKWIFALGQALSNCMGLLDELMSIADTMKTQSQIQSIQDKLDEVFKIKTKLVSFATKNTA